MARDPGVAHVASKGFCVPRRFARLVLLMVALAVSALAQQFGEITGTTTDPSGAGIAGATVSVTNSATQQVRSVTSNDSGVYVLPYLVPGIYNVHVEKPGFKVSTRQAVEVHVDDVIRADFSLQLGEMTQQVEVTGAAPQLNTESAATGSVIGSEQIVDLPLNGRDYLNLVTLSSNASAEDGPEQSTSLQGGTRSLNVITIAGQRIEYSHYTLDGAENTDPNWNSYIIHPSVDALQEFKVQTGIYSAEFGRGASQINVNTLPGTNSYHGAAFEFLRNSDLDAAQWGQVGAKNPFRRNDYGFTLAGPVSIPKVLNGKNHLFFMSNFENLRDVTVVQNRTSVAPDAMRAGNFSLTPGVQIIYDPATRIYPATGAASATPFPGNIIPASRISPQAAILQNASYYPTQTVPGNASLLNNFISNTPTVTKSFQFNQRIDWVENANSTWFGRYSKGDDALNTGGTFFNSGVYVPTDVQQAVLANTRVISPRIVNEARFGWNEFDNFMTGYYAGKTDIQALLGIQGLIAPDPLSWGLPSVGTSPFSYPNGVTPYLTHDDSFQGVEGLSIVKGSHSIKVGGEIRRMRYNEYGNQFAGGSFSFDGGSTCNPASCTSATGYAYADFLLGLPASAIRVATQANGMMRSTYYAGYIQDDWKATHRLTLNLGLRYENQRPWVDKYNGQINPQITGWGVGFIPGNPSGAYLLPGDASITPILTRPGNQPFYADMNLQFAEQPVQNGNQMGPGLVNPSSKNFGPRIGLAYNPWAHWSVRAGFGIFYVQDIGEVEFDLARNRGGKDTNTIANNDRTTTLASPWASEVGNPLCPGFNGPCLVQSQLNAIYQGNTTPYVEQYLLVLQRELTQSTVVEVGYMGSEGHHLNRLVILNTAVERTGPNDQSSIASRRPWPNLGQIQEDMDTVSSNYHSLEGKVTRRTGNGLTLSAAITWSRSIDGGSGTRASRLWPYDSYDLQQMHGPSDFNETFRFVTNFVYDLPFGAGKSLVNHGVAGAIVGGWQVGGILTAYSGLPLTGPTVGDVANIGNTEGEIGNFTGISPVPKNRTPNNWWNAAAFDVTNPDLTYQEGNEAANALQGIGALTLNASLSRNIRILENHRLSIRLDAFNALNQANYNTPSTNYLVPSTFGIVTSAKTMRQLQLSLKYSF
jgi:Carboxypeptidase regulatory-like domain